MQFADSKLPPIPPATDRHEISPKAPASPAHRVVSGFQEAMEQVPAEAPHRQQREDSAGGDSAAPSEAVPYTGQERRAMCRRVRNVPVLLDTRSGEDRRKTDQLGELPATHMDKEV